MREGRRGIEGSEQHVFHSERESYVNAATNWSRHAARLKTKKLVVLVCVKGS